MNIKKTITIPIETEQKIKKMMDEVYRSSFNREINYIIDSYFWKKEAEHEASSIDN